MGVVYRATQLTLGRLVAVKAMAPALAQDADYRERFQRESHIAASIDHPNVIPVYEAGEFDGTLYLIMRWVDGTDLRALLAEHGRLAPARAVGLLRPVASALAAAHRRGLVHRDVKPGNVLIAGGDDGDDEHVYLTDFGIARRTDGEGSMTRTGVLVGTVDYMAPERVEGGKGDAASDIYAFGCMLYETLTGHVPFERPTELTKLFAHINDPVPSARAAATDVPQSLDAVIAKAMAKRSEDRFASAGELAAARGRALEDVETAKVVSPGALEQGGLPTDETEPGPAATVIAAEEPGPPATVIADHEPATVVPLPPAPPEPASTVLRSGTAVEEPATVEREPASRPRALWAVPVALLAVVGVVVAVVASGGGGTKAVPPTDSPPKVLSAVPPVSVGNPISLGKAKTPTAMAADGKNVWVAARGEVAHIVGATVTPFVLADDPTSVAVDPKGRVWMTGVGPTHVAMLDPTAGNHLTAINAGPDPTAIAISTGAAWIANSGNDTVTRVDLGSPSATKTIPVDGRPAALGEAYGRIWVASKNGSVTVLNDDGSRDTVGVPKLPGTSIGVAQNLGVWFLGALGNTQSTLTRVDPEQSKEVNTAGGPQYETHFNQIVAGPLPGGIGALPDDNSIWVLSQGENMLMRFGTGAGGTGSTPKPDRQLIASIQFGSPGYLAVGDHILWVDIPGTGQVYPVRF